jgi:hypothetical protein
MEGKSTTELVALLTVERPNGIGGEKSWASMKIRRKSKKKKKDNAPFEAQGEEAQRARRLEHKDTENARRVDQVVVRRTVELSG